MKFSLGYRLPGDFGSMVDLFRVYRDHIAECYFAMPGDPSGRAPLGVLSGELDREPFHVFWKEIREIVALGIKPVLLYNAACYGKESISKAFHRYFLENLHELNQEIGLATVTTTSPFVAGEVKRHFPAMEVRASVNMRLYSVRSLEYLENSFDSFYVAKEVNRNVSVLRRMKRWAEEHGKTIHLLANSGCLYHCPWQNFHDNMVAHESEIVLQENVSQNAPSPCWHYMNSKENRKTVLRNSWIRPEDIGHYETLCDLVKLASRAHDNPRIVIEAYVKGSFNGNLLSLFEPSFIPLFQHEKIDNTRFPDDWFDRTSQCDRECDVCGYCDDAYVKCLSPRS